MKLTGKLVSLASLLGVAHADFHIVETGSTSQHFLPSNQYNCDALYKHGKISQGSLGGDFFQVTGSTCGAGTLNFYKRSGGHWQAYIANGDGSVKAECYDNSGAKTWYCPLFGGVYPVFEKLVC